MIPAILDIEIGMSQLEIHRQDTDSDVPKMTAELNQLGEDEKNHIIREINDPFTAGYLLGIYTCKAIQEITPPGTKI